MNDAAFSRYGLSDSGTDHIRPKDAGAAANPGRWRECPVRVDRNLGTVVTAVGGEHMTCADAVRYAEARRRGGAINLTAG